VFKRENILFIDYEDFKNDVAGVVNNVYLFLGVNDDFQPNLNKKHNTYTMPKNGIIRYIYSFVSFRNFLTSIFSKGLVKSIRNSLFINDRKPKLSNANREFLNEFFKEDLKELNALLNKDFTKWLK